MLYQALNKPNFRSNLQKIGYYSTEACDAIYDYLNSIDDNPVINLHNISQCFTVYGSLEVFKQWLKDGLEENYSVDKYIEDNFPVILNLESGKIIAIDKFFWIY